MSQFKCHACGAISTFGESVIYDHTYEHSAALATRIDAIVATVSRLTDQVEALEGQVVFLREQKDLQAELIEKHKTHRPLRFA